MRISQNEIPRRSKMSRPCIRQIFRKFDKFHIVATKPSAGCPPKVADRKKRLLNSNNFEMKEAC